ncbi:MAG: GNAT family N-acetyltransferase [Methanosphaera stadtmanae]|nr:GNAT family N-acetyltransferase [Methanosphaera stadtmanae]
MDKKECVDNYKIEKITKHHYLNDFNCENEKLNTFLKKDALEQQNNRFNVTYLAIYNNMILGYYSLLADNIRLKKVDFNIPKEYKNAPAIKIGQFARDKKFKKMGLGSELLDIACRDIKKQSMKFGIKYITVDSYVSARRFYEENDFKYVHNIDFGKIKKAEKRNPNSIVGMYKNVDYI